MVVLMTHPVQYMSPWFRYIDAHAPDIDLTVVYATEPTPSQQGVGFGRSFAWDVPLRDGYHSIVVRQQVDGASFDSDRFFGLHVPEVTHAVRQLHPDAVLVPGWHSITLVRAIVALRRDGVPLLYRGDSHLGTSGGRWPMLSRLRARALVRQFAGYLAVGTRSREYLLAMGAAEPAIVSSPHAVDNDAFRARAADARPRRQQLREQYGFATGDRVVLYAGKLAAVKRPIDVLDAASRLPRSAVLFVGDGPERTALEATAKALGVRVVFAGFLHQRQIAEAYVASDALMVPGRETWGLVANEALACGLPVVISSEAGASVDLVSSGVCEVARPGDTAAFAEKLASVIEHRRIGRGHPDDCLAVVSRFSFERATKGLRAAVTFATRNVRPANRDAAARVVALGGNFVFAGGMERITVEGLRALVDGGADVRMLVNGWSSRPIAELAERAGVTWEVGHYNAPLGGVFRSPRRMARALGDVVMASAHLTALLARRRVTHVFAVDFRAVLVHAPALALCRIVGTPVVLRSGVAPTRTRAHERLWRWIINPLVTAHLANSRFTAGELHAVGVPAERVTTIANVAPRREGSSAAAVRDPRRIVYVGQIIVEKGVLELLDAVATLVARGHDVRLDVVGQMDGWAPDAVHEYRAKLRHRAAAFDLASRVRFLGWREDVDGLLREASIHCCPSQLGLREAFGITVVEAKQAGRPSVVCPSGALPELIEHQQDGWIARGFDGAALAEGLEWFLSDAARLARAQAAAHASAARFDPDSFARHWREAFGMLSGLDPDCAPAAAKSLAPRPQ